MDNIRKVACMKAEKIKPCPFCGGIAVETLVKYRKARKRTWMDIPSVSCKACDITLPVELWNTRVDQS